MLALALLSGCSLLGIGGDAVYVQVEVPGRTVTWDGERALTGFPEPIENRPRSGQSCKPDGPLEAKKGIEFRGNPQAVRVPADQKAFASVHAQGHQGAYWRDTLTGGEKTEVELAIGTELWAFGKNPFRPEFCLYGLPDDRTVTMACLGEPPQVEHVRHTFLVDCGWGDTWVYFGDMLGR